MSRVEEGEDLSGGGGHHDGVVPHVGAFLPKSCFDHIVLYSSVVGLKGLPNLTLHLKSEIEVCKLRQK